MRRVFRSNPSPKDILANNIVKKRFFFAEQKKWYFLILSQVRNPLFIHLKKNMSQTSVY